MQKYLSTEIYKLSKEIISSDCTCDLPTLVYIHGMNTPTTCPVQSYRKKFVIDEVERCVKQIDTFFTRFVLDADKNTRELLRMNAYAAYRAGFSIAMTANACGVISHDEYVTLERILYSAYFVKFYQTKSSVSA